MTDQYEIVMTCPWCTWKQTNTNDARDAGIEQGKRWIKAHMKQKHPQLQLKPGREARVGFYRGEPIS